MAAVAEEHPTITVEDLHPDILMDVLKRLDAPTLALASCATTYLHALSTNPTLWRQLCVSNWPSLALLRQPLPISHRSLFADAYPFPSLSPIPIAVDHNQLPGRLISLVDLFHRDVPILSRVIETNTSTTYFRGWPLRLDALDRNDPDAPDEAGVSPDELRLSWVIIDPSSGRAVDVSSRKAVAFDRHWYTGETVVHFASVLGGGLCAAKALVAVGEESGRVSKVTLRVEDMDEVNLGGREALAVIKGAMEAARGGGEEEVRRRYREFDDRQRRGKERRIKPEGVLHLCCSLLGLALLFGFLAVERLRRPFDRTGWTDLSMGRRLP